MANDKLVAYNPSDAEQNQFLAAIRSIESGGNYFIGTSGGGDLSKYPTDTYGFPIWDGKPSGLAPGKTSHGAGAYQFEPGTWKHVASKYGLNFKNKGDQDRGAWYLAQEVYQRVTGRSLDAALDEGDFQSVQTALRTTWATGGNPAVPEGLAYALSNGVSAEVQPGPTDTSGTPSFLTSPLQASAAYFVRGGMILVGGLILLVALWALLSKADVLPGVVSMGK